MNTFRKLVEERESCRNFSDKEISYEDLKEISEIARLSPSAVNSQPWMMHIVHSKEIIKDIKAAVKDLGMNKFADKAKAFFILTEEKESLTAKVGALIKDQDYVTLDMGILSAHIVLAAKSLGISSCILGWFNENQIRKILRLEKKNKVRLVIALGYSETLPKIKKRKNIDEVTKYY